MITVAAGQDAALVWSAGVVLASPTVTIAPVVGAPVVGPTSAGLGVSGTTYSYVWRVPAATAQGAYTAVLDGTSGGNPVEVTVDLYVTAEPLYATLQTLKESLKITDTDRDALLTGNLAAASRGIDRTCGGRRFWLDPAPVARVINPRGRITRDDDGEHLLVKDIGDVDGLVVEVGRAGAWTDVTSSVEAEPLDALDEQRPVTSLLRSCWPLGQRVRVTARWGWPAVPAVVEQATLIQASRLRKRVDSPEGVTGSAEWGVIRLSRVDPDVQALIEKLILPGIG